MHASDILPTKAGAALTVLAFAANALHRGDLDAARRLVAATLDVLDDEVIS
ncbi:MAG: hypothetical protein IPG50_09465 [Myxococcales bacterium]|nr:hypothetical protein [Myxococcales bacterium]